MNQIASDVEAASKISISRKYSLSYDRIYYQSNEFLNEIFNNISVKDKDVLTVLASSDQLFHSYYHGAKNVDTFDVNRLTYYYYYLRKWGILYFNTFYPPMKDTVFSHKFLSKVLSHHFEFSEEDYDAYVFWRNYCDETWGFQNENLFYLSGRADNKIDDTDFLKEVLKKELSFQHMDISKPMKIEKQYDIIFLSNILEYLTFMDISFEQLIGNLKELLKDDGFVVCSHVMHRYSYDKSRMKNDFYYYELPFVKRKDGLLKGKDVPVGYCYKKK